MSTTIKGKVLSPLAIDTTLTKEYMCADAKATGDAIEQLRKETEETIQPSALLYGGNVSSLKHICYKNGKVCTVVFDFTTKESINNGGVLIYSDLPQPKDNFVFVAHSTNGTAYWLGIYPTETTPKGRMTTAYVNDIPSGTRLFGTVTYITSE